MAKDNSVVLKIKDNTKALNTEATELKNSIEKLKSTIEGIVKEELERLTKTPLEKERIMKQNISKIEQEDFFGIANPITSDDDKKAYAKKAMKFANMERPDNISENDWKSKNLDEQKDLYYDYLIASVTDPTEADLRNAKLNELIFKGMTNEQKEALLKGKHQEYIDNLSIEKKLKLIAKYGQKEKSANEEQEFTDKLKDAQDKIDKEKEKLLKNCNKLIDQMNETIQKNVTLIKDLRFNLNIERENLESDCELAYKDYLNGLNNGDTPEEKDKFINNQYKNTIEYKRKKAIVDGLNKDLKDATAAHNESVAKLEQSIKELGEYAITLKREINEEPIEPTGNESDANNSSSSNSNSNKSQKQLADNSFYNMFGTKNEGGEIDAEDIKKKLRDSSYEELVAQAKQIRGIFKRKHLKEFYKYVWETIQGKAEKDGILDGIEDILKDNEISLNKLQNMRGLNKEQLNKLDKLLSGYKSKSVIEQEQLDSLMDFVKLGLLIKSTNIIPNISRKKKLYISNILKTTKKRASEYYSRESKIISKTNEWLAKVKLPPLKEKMPTPPALNTSEKTADKLR